LEVNKASNHFKTFFYGKHLFQHYLNIFSNCATIGIYIMYTAGICHFYLGNAGLKKLRI